MNPAEVLSNICRHPMVGSLIGIWIVICPTRGVSESWVSHERQLMHENAVSSYTDTVGFLATHSGRGMVTVIDLATNAPIGHAATELAPLDILVSMDGSAVYVIGRRVEDEVQSIVAQYWITSPTSKVSELVLFQGTTGEMQLSEEAGVLLFTMGGTATRVIVTDLQLNTLHERNLSALRSNPTLDGFRNRVLTCYQSGVVENWNLSSNTMSQLWVSGNGTRSISTEHSAYLLGGDVEAELVTDFNGMGPMVIQHVAWFLQSYSVPGENWSGNATLYGGMYPYVGIYAGRVQLDGSGSFAFLQDTQQAFKLGETATALNISFGQGSKRFPRNGLPRLLESSSGFVEYNLETVTKSRLVDMMAGFTSHVAASDNLVVQSKSAPGILGIDAIDVGSVRFVTPGSQSFSGTDALGMDPQKSILTRKTTKGVHFWRFNDQTYFGMVSFPSDTFRSPIDGWSPDGSVFACFMHRNNALTDDPSTRLVQIHGANDLIAGNVTPSSQFSLPGPNGTLACVALTKSGGPLLAAVKYPGNTASLMLVDTSSGVELSSVRLDQLLPESPYEGNLTASITFPNQSGRFHFLNCLSNGTWFVATGNIDDLDSLSVIASGEGTASLAYSSAADFLLLARSDNSTFEAFGGDGSQLIDVISMPYGFELNRQAAKSEFLADGMTFVDGHPSLGLYRVHSAPLRRSLVEPMLLGDPAHPAQGVDENQDGVFDVAEMISVLPTR